ncbi:MAG: M20 family metallopeptidase [Acidobacteriota bacterium]|jgi:glutamate carboxypeptidase
MIEPNDLVAFFDDHLEEALSLLRQLVEMESYSSDKSGIDRLAESLAQEFEARGAPASIIPMNGCGNALKAVWRGTGSGSPILLLGHLDTVWPPGTAAERPFMIREGNAFGPGVFDMKIGIVLCLLLCAAFRKGLFKAGSDVMFLFTSDEEIGSAGGLPVLEPIARLCRAVLCLEPPLPGGMVKTFRKGVGHFHLRVRGISAHAGVDHAKGANAILELSRLVIRLQRMTDYDRGITVSVGKTAGGSAANVVPDSARAEIDFRFSKLMDGHRLERRIRRLRPVDARCGIELEGGINRPPLERTPAVSGLYQKAKSLATTLGFDLGEGKTGGGSDGSFTAALGIPTLDGLGVDGDGAHALNEHIRIADIPRRAALLGLLAQELST